MHATAQGCGICPQPGIGAATSAKLTRLGALGCITAVVRERFDTGDVEQRLDTRCGKGDR
jgi:hypothetical protein